MIGEVLTDDYQNIPRYYTALAEWICCMLPCFFIRESRQGTFAIAAVCTLILMTVWLVWTGDVPIQVWLLCVLLPVGMMFCLLYFTIDISEKMVLYCCMKAFLSAEFMASLEWQLEYLFITEERKEIS